MKNQPMIIKPIRNAQEYEAALATVSANFDNPPQPETAKGNYFDVLISLIEAYELKHFPIDLPKFSAFQDAAQCAIEQAEVIHLTLADQRCFAQALPAPPQPTPALERAFVRRSKFLSTELRHSLVNEGGEV